MPTDTITWDNGVLTIIDQTLLPVDYVQIELRRLEEVWEAIRSLKLRGAPAIGICAAFGVLVGLKERAPQSVRELIDTVSELADHLATARPTAINLFWALDRMRSTAADIDQEGSWEAAFAILEAEAVVIWEEDKRLCRDIGEHGAKLVNEGDGILTHCNAGGLATADYGTALAVLYRAHEQGKAFHVFVDETRPLLQGARLTTWELMRAGIHTTLICDNMAAKVMSEGKIQRVVVGADRIAANGDTANKIGTYGVAVLAHAHGIPFYIAAPSSTFDLTISTGDHIPIEQRGREEVVEGFGKTTAPADVDVYNPAFDVTPARLISGIITETGILKAPFKESIKAHFGTPALPA